MTNMTQERIAIKDYLMEQYELAHNRMIKYKSNADLNSMYYGELQALKSTLIDCKLLSRDEFHMFLDKLNKNYV